ncbi:hypothetical protein FACS1894199_04770 [Bacteroidia bacterium]|nr:hypothetical protein FACS1894199_04770 [Bacteroidia bacterium]
MGENKIIITFALKKMNNNTTIRRRKMPIGDFKTTVHPPKGVDEDYYASQFTTQRVAYPDWWTDGFGSAARETGASRNEGRYYAILAENIPAMGYKTFNIVVENAPDAKASKVSPVSKSSKLPQLSNVSDEANILENEYYKITFDAQGGTVFAGENQLEATATEWNTVQNFVAARNKEAQIVVGSDLVPLFQLGSLIHEKFQRKKTYEKPHVLSFDVVNAIEEPILKDVKEVSFKAFENKFIRLKQK